MTEKGILSQLNILAQCRKYGISLWQCPQFLFLLMGIVIIGASISSYVIGNRYLAEPRMVALLVIFITLVLLVIAFTITRSFERLAQVSRMKSEFISIVSHQLRSPLSNLKWAIELLMSGRLGAIEEKQTEYFKILKENSARMEELVSDLLTVSRIETAGLVLNKKKTSLSRLTQDIIFDFRPFVEASNAQIEFSKNNNLPKIWLDPSQIRLVIENLLDNAVRYIKPVKSAASNGLKEKGIVKISLKKINRAVLFEIKDNGVGIPKEDKKHIFKKFFRSGNVLREQTQGSGLGLYICKAIIEKSGGKIGFESQEGAGSTFWFTLPIK